MYAKTIRDWLGTIKKDDDISMMEYRLKVRSLSDDLIGLGIKIYWQSLAWPLFNDGKCSKVARV